MVQYKLTYFNGRGRAETIRLIFAVAKQEFVDERIERDNWPALKPKAPLGQMPFLEIKEEGKPVVCIGQSMAIGMNFFDQGQTESCAKIIFLLFQLVICPKSSICLARTIWNRLWRR